MAFAEKLAPEVLTESEVQRVRVVPQALPDRKVTQERLDLLDHQAHHQRTKCVETRFDSASPMAHGASGLKRREDRPVVAGLSMQIQAARPHRKNVSCIPITKTRATPTSASLRALRASITPCLPRLSRQPLRAIGTTV